MSKTMLSIIVLVVLVVATGLMGFTFSDLNKRYKDIVAPNGGESKILGFVNEATKLRTGIKDAKKDIAVYESEIYANKLKQGLGEWQVDVTNKSIAAVDGDKEFLERRAGIIASVVEKQGEIGDETLATMDTYYENLNGFQQGVLKDREEISTAIASQKSQEADDFVNQERVLKKQRDLVSTKRAQLDSELVDLTGRDIVRYKNTPDGRVIHVDLEHNLFLINVGSNQGVKPGFRFDVLNTVNGNKVVKKCLLEVQSVEAELSKCLAVRRLVNVPKDKSMDWSASEANMMYSPFISGGASGSQVVPLSRSKIDVEFWVNKKHPPVVGDIIASPFYSGSSKPLNFVVAGSEPPARTGDLWEKIKYSPEVVVRRLLAYGNNVEANVTSKTDVLFAMRNASDQIKRAQSLGVPIIYEIEAFRFLEDTLPGELTMVVAKNFCKIDEAAIEADSDEDEDTEDEDAW